jgi:diaminopimelate decarboxylase
MKSDYNSMNMPASLMVYLDGSASVIERRGNLSDIVRREVEAYSEGRAAVGCS